MAYATAHEAALRDMKTGSTLPRILVEMRKQSNSKFDLVDEIVQSPDARLLIEDDDRMLLFVPQSLTAPTATIQVLEVHRQDVLHTIRTTIVQVH